MVDASLLFIYLYWSIVDYKWIHINFMCTTVIQYFYTLDSI